MSRFAIRAFVGPNGGGKTMAAVEMVALPAWQRGRPVVANFELFPERLGFAADLYRPLRSWREIPDLRSCDFILDEISSALPSRQSASVPAQLIRTLNQLRKNDVTCAWTAPAWQRADTVLREVTQAVTLCMGAYPDRYMRVVPDRGRVFPAAVRDDDGKKVRIEEGWRPNRLFTFQTFEATSYDEFTLAGAKKLRPESRRRYWRSAHRAMHAYSTLQAVDLLDHLDDVGACVVCGGHRVRPKCSCPKGGPEGAGGAVGPAVNGALSVIGGNRR